MNWTFNCTQYSRERPNYTPEILFIHIDDISETYRYRITVDGLHFRPLTTSVIFNSDLSSKQTVYYINNNQIQFDIKYRYKNKFIENGSSFQIETIYVQENKVGVEYITLVSNPIILQFQ